MPRPTHPRPIRSAAAAPGQLGRRAQIAGWARAAGARDRAVRVAARVIKLWAAARGLNNPRRVPPPPRPSGASPLWPGRGVSD